MAGRRQANQEARRDQILGAARAEFARQGYHATQVSDIVRTAGIARGTFYYHYAGKRQVYDDLLETALRLIDENLGHIDPDRPVRAQLMRNVATLVRVLVDNLDMARILLHDAAGLDEDSDQRLARFYDRLLSRIEGTIQEGQRIGFIRDGDPSVIATAIVGTVKEVTYQWILGTRRPPLPGAVREVARFVLDGIVRQPGAP